MKKLTQRDRNNIIYRHKRRESAASLAQRYGVSERMIYKILKEYHETGCVPEEKKAGSGLRAMDAIRNQINTELISGCYTIDLLWKINYRKKTNCYEKLTNTMG